MKTWVKKCRLVVIVFRELYPVTVKFVDCFIWGKVLFAPGTTNSSKKAFVFFGAVGCVSGRRLQDSRIIGDSFYINLLWIQPLIGCALTLPGRVYN